MSKNFLDYTGLTKYTEKLEEFVDSKVAGLVPSTRKVNAKALTEDINLTAYDVDAVPITRQINGHQLGFDLTLTAADLNAVPTSRTVNGKALTSDITLTASDIGVTTPDLSGYVPTSRTVNGKPLTSDISLTAEDIGVSTPDLSGYVPTSRTVNGKALTEDITLTASDIGVTTPDLSGYVPTSRTVNGKALTTNITLSASDVSARPSSWTPTASDVGALPITGGTLTGDLTIKGSGNYGTKINFGDGDYVHISEPTDDCMEIKASKVNFVLSDTTDSKFTVNGSSPFSSSSGVGKSMAGQSVKPTESETVTASNGAEIFNDYRARTFATNGGTAFAGNVASGTYSHAEGFATTSSAEGSHAEGSNTIASGKKSHAEGTYTQATGTAAHAEGYNTKAKGSYSHAEGYESTVEGNYSHVEGSSTTADGSSAHAEGERTKATGACAHAEGQDTTASGWMSHAEGIQTTASGDKSHAEGVFTVASATCSHAEGHRTTASNYASHACGKFNKTTSNDGNTLLSNSGDAFIVGNGTSETALSNALRLAYEGTLYLTKAYNAYGADYAEYFEWLDGNPQAEDRVGRFVTLDGTRIKLAQEGDYILGVVSGQPCIIGNADEDWLGRWEHDDFNRFVKEYLVHNEVEITPPSTDITSEEFHSWFVENDVTERDGHYFKMETEVVDYPTNSWRHKANPNYDPSQSYIERKDRQEWDAVGMVGVLSVIDDGTCEVNGYAKVSSNGIATAAVRHDTVDTWRVAARVTPNIIKVIFSIK